MRKFAVLNFFMLVFCLLSINHNSFAVSGGPSGENVTVKPGEVYQGKVYSNNTGKEPVIVMVKQTDLIKTESGGTSYSDTALPKGLLQWTKFDTKQEATLNPSERVDFNYTITIPNDAAPGTYTGGFLLTEKSLEAANAESAGANVAVSAQILSQLYLTVEGDYTEKLTLQKFEANKNEFLKGNIVFDIDIKNEGDVLETPRGTITIYDDKNNQIKGIFPILQEFDNQEVVIERKDEIPVNPNLSLVILPQSTKIIQAPWTHRNVDTGKYTAKMVLFYGDKNEKLESQSNFELVDNFVISTLTPESYFNAGLPVKFSTKLQNIGTLPATPTGYFAINNVFGAQKYRQDFIDKQLYMPGGEEKQLTNLIWDQGFALGTYNAVISLNVNGKTYSSSVMFWVINWWQILIVVILVLTIVFLLYKGIKGYIKMKKKLSKLKE